MFEAYVAERIACARYTDAEPLVENGRLLNEHGFEHHAAQLFRHAAELDPNLGTAWAGLAQTTEDENELAQALERCLALDEGLTAAEIPEPPRSLYRAAPAATPFSLAAEWHAANADH